MAAPGRYAVRLTADGSVSEQLLVVRRHPLYTDVTDADLAEQFALAMELREKVTEANAAVIRIRALKSEIADRLSKSSDAALKAAARLVDSLSAVEEIYQVRNQSGQDPLNYPIKINNWIASLYGVVNRGDAKPIANARPIFEDLKKELKVQTDRLDRVFQNELSPVNAELRKLGLREVDGR